MSVPRLKVVLTVLAKKSKNTSEQCINHAVPESLFQLPQEEFFKDVDLDILKRGMKDLISSKDKLPDSPEGKHIPILFKVLLVIFSNTTQKERLYHLKDLLEHFHDALTENQLKTAGSSSVLSKKVYHRLVRQCLPLVKFETVQQQLKKYESKQAEEASALKIAIGEFYECVRFPKILREECYEIAKKKLGSKDFELQQFELCDMEESEGSLGIYAKLKIFVKHQGKSQELRFFVKYLLGTGEALRAMSEGGFKKEDFMYTVFVPFFKQMGMDKLVDFLPECYLSRPDEILLLDDVSVEGFSILDVSAPFDLDHLLEPVKQFAKLHAASLILEEKLSESLGETARINEYYGEYLVDLFYAPSNGFERLVPGFVKYFLKRCPQIPKKLSVEEIEERVKEQTGKWLEGVGKSDKYRNVLCHGDSWCNNILFQHNGEKKPQGSYLIDFQLARYCPPGFEILYFIYTTTDKKTRSKHLTYLLEYYHAELKKHLNEYGIDVESIYPSETFLECCETMKLAALFHSIVYLQYILIPKEKLEEMKRDRELMWKYMSAGDRNLLFDDIWYHLPFRTRLTENIEEVCGICENL